MRIASITMIGQFPHGIDLHVSNLRWALTNEDHIYIVTLPQFIKKFNLINNKTTTYIPFEHEGEGFIKFWKEFPKIIKEYKINPEWFLFMEQDIWFFAHPNIPDDPQTITSFLPRGDYRNVLFRDNLMHSRVSECAQIIHNSVIQGAISFGVEFSFAKETFVERSKGRYTGVTFSMPGQKDTMEELSLYCALIKKTILKHDVKASHLRGPESIHRLYPDVYQGVSFERLKEIQKEINYVDIFLIIVVYYLCGVWEDISWLKYDVLKKDSKKEILRILEFGQKWMPAAVYAKLLRWKNGSHHRDGFRP